jgi:hypothetical protein
VGLGGRHRNVAPIAGLISGVEGGCPPRQCPVRSSATTTRTEILGRTSDGSRALSNVEVDSVAGGLNALMIPSAVVAAVMAALDMDEYWIPYFNQKMDEAGK